MRAAQPDSERIGWGRGSSRATWERAGLWRERLGAWAVGAPSTLQRGDLPWRRGQRNDGEDSFQPGFNRPSAPPPQVRLGSCSQASTTLCKCELLACTAVRVLRVLSEWDRVWAPGAGEQGLQPLF